MLKRGAARYAAALFVCLISASGVAQDAESVFKEAMDLYQRGRDSEALVKIKEFLATDPSSETAWKLRSTLEAREWSSLLIKGGEHEAAFRDFFARSIPAAREHLADPAAIKALIATMDGGKWGEMQKAMLKLAADHGEYAVPELLPRLASESTETRATTMEWLRRLGRQSTMPLIQALDMDNPMMVSSALSVLGQLKDRRALPYVAAKAMGPGAEAGSVIQTAASRALAELGQGASVSADLAGNFLSLAESYYRRSEDVVDPFRATYTVWGSADGALTAHEVPRDLYHLKLAEEVLFDALALFPAHRDAQVLLTSVLLAQQDVGTGASAEETQAAALRRAGDLASVYGPEVLDATIAKAMADGRSSVATSAIRLLASTITGEQAGSFTGLNQAVGSSQKDVKYEAALALAMLAPGGGYAAQDQVVPALADALGQDAIRTVVVIDDREETRNRLIADLNARGYFAYGTPSGALGVAAVREYPVEDLVIVRYNLNDATAFQVVKELKGDARTAEKPIAVLVDAADVTAAKSAFGDKVQAFIETPLVAEGYEPSLRALVTGTDTSREAATQIAVRAAQTLAHLPPRGAGLTSGAAVPALLATLKGDDRVRSAALMALGRIGDPSSTTAILELFKDSTAPEAVRSHAAHALASVARSAGNADATVVQALMDAVKGEGGADYLTSLARACGVLPVDGAAKRELLGALRSRIKVDLKE